MTKATLVQPAEGICDTCGWSVWLTQLPTRWNDKIPTEDGYEFVEHQCPA